MANLMTRLKETARLMVGVGSYEKYREHLCTHHPEIIPMTETEYFRYCQNSRYPSGDGEIKRCPC